MERFEKPIVFFDGVCTLCNHSVRWVDNLDKHNKLNFASLQSKTFKELLKNHPELEQVDSIVFYCESAAYTKSTALIQIAKKLNRFSFLSWLAGLFSLRFRDFLYDLIARNRYNWFGKKDICDITDFDLSNKILE